MIIFNCTKSAEKYLFPKEGKQKLQETKTEKLKMDFDIEYTGEKSAPITQWLVTHSKVGSQDVLFVCHTIHRYTIMLTEIKKGDVEEFLFIVYWRLVAQFAHWKALMPFAINSEPELWMENFIKTHKGYFFRTGWSAAIQPTVNSVSKHLADYFNRTGYLPNNEVEGTYFDVAENLNFVWTKKQNHSIIPAYEFFNEFLEKYMGIEKKDIKSFSLAAKEVIENERFNNEFHPAKEPLIEIPQVYQFKIQLLDFKPIIWRKFQVVNSISLENFHDICQAVMGWDNNHMHQFSKTKQRIEDEEMLLGNVLTSKKQALVYEYDFGDGWEHRITLEKILPFDGKQKLPLCLEGENACPPEDCGGVWGYAEMLEIQNDPEHPDYENIMEWLCKPIDPNQFDLKAVNKRLKLLSKNKKSSFVASELLK